MTKMNVEEFRAKINPYAKGNIYRCICTLGEHGKTTEDFSGVRFFLSYDGNEWAIRLPDGTIGSGTTFEEAWIQIYGEAE